jgi:hypothetical protein
VWFVGLGGLNIPAEWVRSPSEYYLDGVNSVDAFGVWNQIASKPWMGIGNTDGSDTVVPIKNEAWWDWYRSTWNESRSSPLPGNSPPQSLRR